MGQFFDPVSGRSYDCCPKCGLEHSASWTCEQAGAYAGSAVVGPEAPGKVESPQVEEAQEVRFDRASFMRDMWKRRKDAKRHKGS